MEKLEAEILRSVTRIRRAYMLKEHIQARFLDYCAKLRNQISAYKLSRSDAEVDDLIFAMIRDDALTVDQIKFVFDLSDSLFALAIKRMQERDRV